MVLEFLTKIRVYLINVTRNFDKNNFFRASIYLVNENVSSNELLVMHPAVTDEQDSSDGVDDIVRVLRVVRAYPQHRHSESLVGQLGEGDHVPVGDNETELT